MIGKVATGATLSRDEAASAFDSMMSGEATPSQMGGLLMALRVRGETVDEITGAVSAMRAKMLRVKAPADAVDVVGTGGDGSGSVNVRPAPRSLSQAPAYPSPSTATARCRRVGRRRRAVLARRQDRHHAGAGRPLHAEAGIGFMFAPSHHPAMKNVGPTRVELATRTIFNLLGPLSNPAGVTRQMVGVFSRQYAERSGAAEGQGRLPAWDHPSSSSRSGSVSSRSRTPTRCCFPRRGTRSATWSTTTYRSARASSARSTTGRRRCAAFPTGSTGSRSTRSACPRSARSGSRPPASRFPQAGMPTSSA